MSGVYSVSTSEERRTGYIFTPTYSAYDEKNFPEVPDSPSVNIATLTKGDPEPKYVTRPLVILDEVSRNGLEYNQAMFDDIFQQAVGKPARRGHISAAEKSTAFPHDEGYWVGVLIDSSFYGKPTVWGKCYLAYDMPLKNMVLRREAVGGTISNSIWGDVTEVVDEQGHMVPVSLSLESIDFVPEERAALQVLGGDFKVTSEMKEDDMADKGSDHDKDDVSETVSFKEAAHGMTAEKIYEVLHEMGQTHSVAEAHLKSGTCAECTGATMSEMLSEAVRRQVAETHVREKASLEETYGMLSEAQRKHVMETFAHECNMSVKAKEEETKAVSEMVNVQTQVSEMGEVIKRYERKEFERALTDTMDSFFTDWHINTEDGRAKVGALKNNLRVLTVAEMAGSIKVEDIKPAADKAWEVNVKPLAEMTRASLAGPSAFTGPSKGAVSKVGWNAQTGRYDDDFVAQATRMTGVLGGRSGGVK